MSDFNKMNSTTEQAKSLDDLNHQINRLTLNIHQKLGLDTPNGVHRSNAQAQANQFYKVLKSHLEQNTNKQKELLNSSIINASALKKNSAKKVAAAAACGVGGIAGVTGGVVLQQDTWTQLNNAIQKNTPVQKALEQAKNPVTTYEDNLSKTPSADQPELFGKLLQAKTHLDSTQKEASITEEALKEAHMENLGELTLLGGSISLIGASVYLVKDCIQTQKRKHEIQRTGKYLNEDFQPILNLICSLVTLYYVEQLAQEVHLNESELHLLAKKECDQFIKNLTKPETKLPHQIANKLLSDSPSSDYTLEERIKSFKHCLGALEESLRKNNSSKACDAFLNELDALCQKRESNPIAHPLKKPNKLQTTNPHTLFSLPKKNEHSVAHLNAVHHSQKYV